MRSRRNGRTSATQAYFVAVTMVIAPIRLPDKHSDQS